MQCVLVFCAVAWCFVFALPFLFGCKSGRPSLLVETLSSWRRFPRLDLDKSDTTTSIKKFDELPAFTRSVRSTSTSFLSRTPPIWFDIWLL